MKTQTTVVLNIKTNKPAPLESLQDKALGNLESAESIVYSITQKPPEAVIF